MIEKLIEIIDEAAGDIGLCDHTTLGLNAIESELLYMDQQLERHVDSSPISSHNPKQ